MEDELNESNEYYLSRGIAVIHKKPVPVQIVKVSYPARSAARITEAYFRCTIDDGLITAYGKVSISISKQKKRKAIHHFH